MLLFIGKTCNNIPSEGSEAKSSRHESAGAETVVFNAYATPTISSSALSMRVLLVRIIVVMVETMGYIFDSEFICAAMPVHCACIQ
jgi:hypothetical protein